MDGTVGISVARGTSATKSFWSTRYFSLARFWVSPPLWKHFPTTPEVIWANELYFHDVLIERIVLIYAMHIFATFPVPLSTASVHRLGEVPKLEILNMVILYVIGHDF